MERCSLSLGCLVAWLLGWLVAKLPVNRTHCTPLRRVCESSASRLRVCLLACLLDCFFTRLLLHATNHLRARVGQSARQEGSANWQLNCFVSWRRVREAAGNYSSSPSVSPIDVSVSRVSISHSTRAPAERYFRLGLPVSLGTAICDNVDCHAVPTLSTPC